MVFFYGYNPIVVAVVIMQASGGLVIALVVKYADNILKCFALAISIVINSILSVYIFNFNITPFFAFGASFVVIAVYVYSTKPNSK